MSYSDYIPHRMLLNRSLRKSSDELRRRADEYQSEYERRASECRERIEATELELRTEREIVQAMLVRELDEAEAELRLFCDDIVAYVDRYLYFECLRRIKPIRSAQIDIYREDEGFLSKQMRLIGDEIDLLRNRKAELQSYVDIKDIVELADLTGAPPLNLKDCEDCGSLLKQVRSRLDELKDNGDSEYYALKRFNLIVQERAEHLYAIQYIDWIIRQKKIYSAQLKRKRDMVRDERGEAEASMSLLEEEMADIDHELDVLAEKVRMRWTRPIVQLSADMCYAIQQKREVGHKLHSIASRHEYDSDWDDLESRRRRLEGDVGRLREERDGWYNRRGTVFGICRSNGAPLRSDRQKGRDDQIKLVRARLDEIQQIREEGAADAETRYEADKRDITSAWDERLRALNADLSGIEAQERDLENQERNSRDEIATATRRLRAAEVADRRFILFRFIPTEEIATARSDLRGASTRHASVAAELAAVAVKRSEKQAEIAEANSQYEKRLRSCRPRYLRPNSDERLEEKKLQLVLEKLENGRRKGARR